MKGVPDIKEHKEPVKFFVSHFANAVDEFKRAGDISNSKANTKIMMEYRYATSSIIHSFLALDSLINYVGYEIFFNEQSGVFIYNAKRSYALNLAVNLWKGQRLSVLEKIQLILTESNSEPLNPNLILKIKELKELRNIIIHGNPYLETFREEITWDGLRPISTLKERVDTFDLNKFEKTKFNSPGGLSKTDAKTALEIVIEIILHMVSQFKWFHPTFVTFYGGEKEHEIILDSTFDALIEDFDAV